MIALPVIFSPKKRTMTTEYNRIASKQDDDSLDRETGDHAVASRTECASDTKGNIQINLHHYSIHIEQATTDILSGCRRANHVRIQRSSGVGGFDDAIIHPPVDTA